MYFTELHIQTRRERPARARSEGESWLLRAGYLDSDGHPTALGQMAADRLSTNLAERADWRVLMGLPILTTDEGQLAALSSIGDARLLLCPRCGYTAESHTARSRKTQLPAESPAPVERIETPDCHTIDSLAAYLNIPVEKTAKAMLYTRGDNAGLVFVLLRGDMQVSERKLTRIVGDVQPASEERIKAAGAVPGYASPVGLNGIFVLVDDVIPTSPNLVAGANEFGFHLKNVNFGRDFTADQVADVSMVVAGDACINCGAALESRTGIMLSNPGSIDYHRLLLLIAERHHDERGLVLPLGASAFDVHVLHLPGRRLDTRAAATRIYQDLLARGLHVLFDDREERAGVKFNDADLIGCPLRVTVGEKHLENRMIELKSRADSSSLLIPIEEIVSTVQSKVSLPA